MLDNYNRGSNWLQENSIAKLVYDAIRFRDKKEYSLICFTIMPNHIHMVIKSLNLDVDDNSVGRNSVPSYILSKILQRLKRYTALHCNKLLNRTGAFWQEESYDHVVRDDDELKRIIAYVVNNPVKAGLCKAWDEWRWTYLNKDYI